MERKYNSVFLLRQLFSPPGQELILLGGDSGDRTRDLLLAGQALSHLSYAPGLEFFKNPARVLKIE